MGSEGEEGDTKQGVIRRALSPAASDFGQEVKPLGKEVGEVTVRAVRIGLRTVSGMVWGFEQIADFVERTVAEKLKDVPPENIVEANPRITVPAVEALRYSGSEVDIREMFANLIATDLNKDTKNRAHPSFVEMIKEMSVEDAKLLKSIRTDRGAILYQGRVRQDSEPGVFMETNLLLTAQVPDTSLSQLLTATYSLQRLGLISFSETAGPAGAAREKVEAYKKGEAHKAYLKQIEAEPNSRFENYEIGIFLTPLGEDFARACL